MCIKGATTFSIVTLSIMTINIPTLTIMTHSVMTQPNDDLNYDFVIGMMPINIMPLI